jgi:hypothetical protein
VLIITRVGILYTKNVKFRYSGILGFELKWNSELVS